MDEDCVGLEGIPNTDLVELATSPQSMTVDGRSYTERTADDLIKMDQYLRAKKAACSRGGGWGQMRINKVIPPGTT